MNLSIRIALFCCLATATLLAQLPTDSPVDVLRHPGWDKGVFIGGGHSVDSSPSGGSFLVGFRLGRVLTNEHGKGFLRGTFEMAGDVIPLNEYWIHGGQYAGGINPFIAKWNFTSPCKVAPYFAAVGGVLFSTHDLPEPGTAQVNFTSGPEIGLQIFGKNRTSWDLALKAYHLSNASIGNHNPGINASLQFMLGYTWY
ncbi:MAG: acyloxyacyl hydrolase [Candidatus Korobacteraceae bacterium]